jgi:S-formylglutathione hydrolase FrmB
MYRIFKFLLAFLCLCHPCSFELTAQNTSCNKPLRFRVTLAKETTPKATAGRLFVLMSDSSQKHQTLTVDFNLANTWIAAAEVTHMLPGQTIEFNPDLKAYPRPFSQAYPGTYQLMALLDPDHSYAYSGQNEGDLYGPVIKVENMNPADTSPIELVLDRRTEPPLKVADREGIKLAEFQSPLLTCFWGRPIKMRAGVVLPPSYGRTLRQTYPTVYHVHGFGGNHTSAWRRGETLIKAMTGGKQREMVHVFLDGSFPTGHHEFADSVNNGPWGRALTEEFIPHLEKRFRLIPRAYARFLTGHSSGGWSTLWLQVNYPEFFGGTWSTAPDPVDLHSFTGIDVTPGSTENAYRTREGRARNLVRMGGKEVTSTEEFAKREEVLGDYGGQLASFEWVWSPKGQDGRPMRLFDRETGELDPEVQQAWQKYDIRLILERKWATLGPKLRGKVSVICGGADTFHLEEAVAMLCDFFKQKGSDARCEVVPGRDHGNLYEPFRTYPDGLDARIAKQMQAKFEASTKGAASQLKHKSRAPSRLGD